MSIVVVDPVHKSNIERPVSIDTGLILTLKQIAEGITKLEKAFS